MPKITDLSLVGTVSIHTGDNGIRYGTCSNLKNYQIFENGTVFNVVSQYWLQGSITPKGYKRIAFGDFKWGSKQSDIRMGTLLCFIFHGPRPSPLHTADHIDRKRLNDVASNLKWSDKHEQNMNQDHPGTTIGSRNRPVIQLSKDGLTEINRFTGVQQAGRIAFPDKPNAFTDISKVINGKKLSAYGYQWKHANPLPNLTVIDKSGEKWAELKNRRKYFISTHGRICKMKSDGICELVHDRDIYPLHINDDGYFEYSYEIVKGKLTKFLLHALVAEYHIGPRPTDYVIDHLNSDKLNNPVSNLEYITQQENVLRWMRRKQLQLSSLQVNGVDQEITNAKRVMERSDEEVDEPQRKRSRR